jgi:hypothetical protein
MIRRIGLSGFWRSMWDRATRRSPSRRSSESKPGIRAGRTRISPRHGLSTKDGSGSLTRNIGRRHTCPHAVAPNKRHPQSSSIASGRFVGKRFQQYRSKKALPRGIMCLSKVHVVEAPRVVDACSHGNRASVVLVTDAILSSDNVNFVSGDYSPLLCSSLSLASFLSISSALAVQTNGRGFF